jgi:group I intron endonuclease
VNRKCYIGSTSTIGFLKRWYKHVQDLNNKNHHSIYLQRSWNKYGQQNFKFDIVERCLPRNCVKREQHYLDNLKPEYNMSPTAGSTLGTKLNKKYCDELKVVRRGKQNPFYGKHHTEKTKKKIRIGLIGKVEGKNNPMYGKGYKLKGKKNGFYGKFHTAKTKEIISKNNRGKFLSDKHSNFVGKYKFMHGLYGIEICGMCDLVRKYGLNPSHVWSICNGDRNLHKGWVCLEKI